MSVYNLSKNNEKVNRNNSFTSSRIFKIVRSMAAVAVDPVASDVIGRTRAMSGRRNVSLAARFVHYSARRCHSGATASAA